MGRVKHRKNESQEEESRAPSAIAIRRAAATAGRAKESPAGRAEESPAGRAEEEDSTAAKTAGEGKGYC